MENTITEREQGASSTNVAQFQDKVIEAPVFIIFAEYLGYVSRFNKLAADWCDGEIPEPYIQKVIIVEAKSIYRQMLKDYGLDMIKYWYETYQPVIIGEYEEKLSKVLEPEE